MILCKNTKILRFQLDSISIRKKDSCNCKEKITFFLKNIKFETVPVFLSEKRFLDTFLMGESIICTHEFKETDTPFTNTSKYLILYENGIVMIVLI